MAKSKFTESRRMFRSQVDLPCAITVLGESGRVYGSGSAVLSDGNRLGVGLSQVRLHRGNLPSEVHHVIVMPKNSAKGAWAKILPVRTKTVGDVAFIGGSILNASSAFAWLF